MVEIPLLIELKKNHTDKLKKLLTQKIYEGISSIFEKAKTLGNSEKKILIGFQKLLRKIPEWNNNIVDNEYERVVNETKFDNYGKLIKTIIFAQYKIITKGQKTTNGVNVPIAKDFLHKVYIECARKFFLTPSFFIKTNNMNDDQQNFSKCLEMIEQSIDSVIQDSVSYDEGLTTIEDVSNKYEEKELKLLSPEPKKEEINLSPELELKNDPISEPINIAGGSPVLNLDDDIKINDKTPMINLAFTTENFNVVSPKKDTNILNEINQEVKKAAGLDILETPINISQKKDINSPSEFKIIFSDDDKPKQVNNMTSPKPTLNLSPSPKPGSPEPINFSEKINNIFTPSDNNNVKEIKVVANKRNLKKMNINNNIETLLSNNNNIEETYAVSDNIVSLIQLSDDNIGGNNIPEIFSDEDDDNNVPPIFSEASVSNTNKVLEKKYEKAMFELKKSKNYLRKSHEKYNKLKKQARATVQKYKYSNENNIPLQTQPPQMQYQVQPVQSHILSQNIELKNKIKSADRKSQNKSGGRKSQNKSVDRKSQDKSGDRKSQDKSGDRKSQDKSGSNKSVDRKSQDKSGDRKSQDKSGTNKSGDRK